MHACLHGVSGHGLSLSSSSKADTPAHALPDCDNKSKTTGTSALATDYVLTVAHLAVEASVLTVGYILRRPASVALFLLCGEIATNNTRLCATTFCDRMTHGAVSLTVLSADLRLCSATRCKREMIEGADEGN